MSRKIFSYFIRIILFLLAMGAVYYVHYYIPIVSHIKTVIYIVLITIIAASIMIFRKYNFEICNNFSNIRVRFAPSPTGEMHVGNLRTAIFNYVYAKQKNAKFFLRIEDTDRIRSKVEYEESIKDTLKWLNIQYESEILRQSERFDIYNAKAQELYKQQCAYYCQCINAITIEANENNHLEQDMKSCPCESKDFKSGVLRFLVPRNRIMSFTDEILGKIIVNTNTIENFALVRTDGSPTYNFVVVIDDIELKITHVFRGNEHLYNTFKQLLIYEALGQSCPKFGHFPMINGKDGKKLSKRSGDTSVRYYREIGVLPEALFNFLIRLGWGYGNQEIFTMEEAIKLFNINKISRSPAFFDMDKLMYLCGYYLQLNWKSHLEEILSFINKKIAKTLNKKEIEIIIRLIPEFAKRSKLISDLADHLLFILLPIPPSQIQQTNINKDLLDKILITLNNISQNQWQEEIIQNIFKEKFPNQMKEVCALIRLIILNVTYSPSIFLILEILGKTESLKRLNINFIS